MGNEVSIFTQESTPLPRRETIFVPTVRKIDSPSPRIFNQKSFIPEGITLGKEEEEILRSLRFGNDSSEKFLTLDQSVMGAFHHEHALVIDVLYREEFSRSRTLMNRLVEIIEEGEAVDTFFTFWTKRQPKARATEMQQILTTLEQYEKKIAASRIELEHHLAVFGHLKETLRHYQNVIGYLLEKGNYGIFSHPDEIRSILIHKAATLQEAFLTIDQGYELRTLKRYLIHFSLVVEEIKIRFTPVLLTLAHDHLPITPQLKQNMIQTVKGFLDE